MPQIDIQNLSRSCNEVLILATLRRGPHHGYQLALELEEKSGGTFGFKHGTLYPILHKLEQDELIRGKWLDEGLKRKRRSYQLTHKGRLYLDSQTEAWHSFFDHLFAVLEEETS